LLFVGLTGGIGAGKSEALAAFQRLGAATLSSDAVVHDLLGSEAVRELLAERWGERVLKNGSVDRAAVAEIVFADPDELSWLERTLFPLVGQRTAEWRAGLERSVAPPEVAVVEVPLLFEAGIESVFDATIAVVTDEATREQRAAARQQGGLGGRQARQLTQEEKAARADHVVRNDGSLEQLERSMADVLARLRAGKAPT
jgi:dephospho-CoA kinase